MILVSPQLDTSYAMASDSDSDTMANTPVPRPKTPKTCLWSLRLRVATALFRHKNLKLISLSNSKFISLIDSGDLTLVVGWKYSYDEARIKVYSHALILSSTFWKAMLSPNRFLESLAKGISFPDDNMEAIVLVLHIAHLSFQ